jgi:hypothetical protein
LNALLLRFSLDIIEFTSALTLVFLALGWSLRHVADALFSLALDINHIRARIRAARKQSAEPELIVPEQGLSGR